MKKPDLREKHAAVIATNLEKGYIRKLDVQNEVCWFIPHFPVAREDKQATKSEICDGCCVQSWRTLPELRNADWTKTVKR